MKRINALVRSSKWMGCAGLVAGLTLSGGSAQAFPFHPIATAPLPDGEVVEQLTFNLRPGLETGWHYHQGDIWVVVLSGTLTEDRGCNQPPEVHEAGTAFAEAPGVLHNVTNTGNDVAKIAVQGVGPSCTANYNDAVSVSGPPACDENDNPEIVPGPYCP